MFANVSAHRRARAFAQALEARESEARGAADAVADPDRRAAEQPGASADTGERQRLLAVAGELATLPSPQLDRDVHAAQRAQVVAAMEAAFADGPPRVPEQRSGRGEHRSAPLSRLRPRSRWGKGLAAGGLTVGVAAGAFGGVAAASSDALPGDTLYGLKRSMEDLRLEMANGDADRGRIYLDQASTRLSEAGRLMERDRSGPLDHESLSEVRRALSGMRHDASEGHRLLHGVYERDGSLGAIQTLSSFAKNHRGGWSKLRRRLPVQLTDVSDQVNSVFDAIDEEVGPLTSLLPSPTGSSEDPGRRGHGVPERTESAHEDSPAPISSPPGGGAGSTRRPGPGSSGAEHGQGLISGAGGLLDPPSQGGSAHPSAGKGGAGDGDPQADVTIPPVLHDLLPGIGVDQDDDS